MYRGDFNVNSVTRNIPFTLSFCFKFLLAYTAEQLPCVKKSDKKIKDKIMIKDKTNSGLTLRSIDDIHKFVKLIHLTSSS